MLLLKWTCCLKKKKKLKVTNTIFAVFSSGHQICIDPKTTSLPEGMMGVEVSGSTMGIIGMGDIGYKIAKRGRGFDMKILYHNRNRR